MASAISQLAKKLSPSTCKIRLFVSVFKADEINPSFAAAPRRIVHNGRQPDDFAGMAWTIAVQANDKR
jgi:hypothetical protein